MSGQRGSGGLLDQKDPLEVDPFEDEYLKIHLKVSIKYEKLGAHR